MVPKKPVVFVHRAGRHKDDAQNDNTISRAKATMAHQKVNGIEIDVRVTLDGVPVVIHENVRLLTYKAFKKRFPNHRSLAQWVGWIKKHPEKTIYIDLKDYFHATMLFELIKPVRRRVWIGSRSTYRVLQLLQERKERKWKIPVYLMRMIPLFPKTQIRSAHRYFSRHNVKPDGIHFSHDDLAPFGLRWLHHAVLKRFVSASKKRGYSVLAGATSNKKVISRMLRWGTVGVMPDRTDYIPEDM